MPTTPPTRVSLSLLFPIHEYSCYFVTRVVVIVDDVVVNVVVVVVVIQTRQPLCTTPSDYRHS